MWWRKRSAPKIAPKAADVFDAVADVAPVLPHAVERKIPNRAGFVLEAVGVPRYANLNNGPLAEAPRLATGPGRELAKLMHIVLKCAA